MKYIIVPEPFEILDPPSRRPVGARCTFIESVRLALISAFQKQAKPPQSKLDDLDESFADAQPGDVVKLEDDSAKILADEFASPNPGVFTVAWGFSSKSHRRAVLDAKSTSPQVDGVTGTRIVSPNAS
jgi:hypothetical protein